MEHSSTKRTMEGCVQCKISNEKCQKLFNEVVSLESQKNKLLVGELQKYDRLTKEKNDMKLMYEEEIARLKREHQQETDAANQRHGSTVKDLEMQLDNLTVEWDKEKSKSADMIRLMKNEVEEEICKTKNMVDDLERSNAEDRAKLNVQIGDLQLKIESHRKDLEERKLEIAKLMKEKTKLQATIKSLNRDNSALNKEEKKLKDLLRPMEELKKLKFVLEHNIEALESKLEPQQLKIEDQTKEIKSMEDELTRQRRNLEDSKLNIAMLRHNVKCRDGEIKRLTDKNRILSTRISRICSDLSMCADLVQNPTKLSEAVKLLKSKYVSSIELTENKDGLSVVMNNHAHQVQSLEKSILALKDATQRDEKRHRMENNALVKENMELLDELKDLKKKTFI